MIRNCIRTATMIVLAASAATSPAAAQESTAPPAGWTVTPGLLAKSTWDNNAMLRGRGDAIASDFVSMVNPRADVGFRGRRGVLTAKYEGAFRLYRDLSSLNSYDQFVSVSGRRLVSRHVTLFARNDVGTSPSTDLIDLVGVPFVRTGSMTEYLQGGVEAALSKQTSLSGSYSFQAVRFDDSPLLTYQLPGGHSHGGAFGLRHVLGDQTALTADYELQHASIGEVQDFFDIHRTLGGIEHQLSERIRISAAFGFSRLLVNSAGPARSGPSWRAGISQSFEVGSASASYTRSFVPSYGFGGTQQNEELTGRGLVSLSRNIYAQSAVIWRINEPLTAGGLKLHSLSVQAAVGYALLPWARLEGFYDTSSHHIDRPGGIVNVHRIGAQILTNKPIRVR